MIREFLKDGPHWGSVCWPLSTWLFYSQGNYGMVLFAAFWAGVSIEKFLRQNKTN